MKIDALKFGFATAIVFALAWLVCSLFVFSMPFGMMRMSGHMMHANLGHMSWALNWAGFIYGLVAWSLIAGFIAWAVASLYNRLVG